MHRPLCSALLLLGLLGFPTFASAQAPDSQKASAAQALFDQAAEEMEKKSFAAACPKLEEATKLIPEALGARMALAECYEGRGKLASAWSQYAMVEGLATKANQPERAEAAGKHAREIKPKLATLTIELGSGVDAIAGLTITRDGLDAGVGQRGVAFPADVGSHQIVVTAPGYKPWKKSLEILADGAATTVKIPMLLVDANASVAAGVTHSGSARPWQRPFGIGAMTVGGLGLGVGALLGGLAIGKNKESNQSECNERNQCTDAGLDQRKSALGLGYGSTAAIIAGGVVAAGGLVLMLTAPPRAPESAGAKDGAIASVALAATLGGLKLEGTW